MVYVIDNIELHTTTQELLDEGVPQKIEPLIFNLLVFMLKNANRVLSRDELISKVWASRVISDSALSASISAARHIIGDTGKQQKYIKTVSGSGYRFIASFQQYDDTVMTKVYSSSHNKNKEIKDTIKELPQLPDKPSIAIMDFVDISKQQDASLLAFGLTAEINATFARMPHFFVISRASAGKLSNSNLSSDEIGKRLGVRYLVYGKLEYVAKHVRVILSIVDAIQNTEIWSEHFDNNIDDLLQIQFDITQSIVAATDSAIEHAEIERSFLIPTENLTAWENFHRGLWYIDRTSLRDVDAAEYFFKKSLKIDTRLSRAYAGLSYTHTNRSLLNHTLIKETDKNMVHAINYAKQAIEYNEHEMSGYMCLGRATLNTNKVDQALILLDQAIKLCPNSPHTFGINAQAVAKKGDDYALALECIQQSNRLNPYCYFNKLVIKMVHSKIMLDQKHYTKAIASIERGLHYNDSYYLGHALAAACYQLDGNQKIAQHYIFQALDLLPRCTIDSCQRLFSDKKEPHDRLINALLDAGMPNSTH